MRIAVCGLLLLAAVAVGSLGAPRGQRLAVMATGCVLLLNWVLYTCAWVAPYYSPASVAWRWMHVDAQPREMWALADAVSASVIVCIGVMGHSRSEKWCLALWSLLVCQIVTHGLVKTGAIEAETSLRVLDFFFYGQLAVYLFIGRKGVGDVIRGFLSDTDNRAGDAHGSRKPTSPRSQAD